MAASPSNGTLVRAYSTASFFPSINAATGAFYHRVCAERCHVLDAICAISRLDSGCACWIHSSCSAISSAQLASSGGLKYIRDLPTRYYVYGEGQLPCKSLGFCTTFAQCCRWPFASCFLLIQLLRLACCLRISLLC